MKTEIGNCVMCGELGDHFVKDKEGNKELLCGRCWRINDELVAKNRGDRIIKFK